LFALTLAAATACSGTVDRATAPTAQPGLRLVSGTNVRDTAAAVVAAPLVAELHDSAGRAIVNAPLLFSVRGGDALVLADPAARAASTSLVVATDTAGRARVWLQLGGAAKVVIFDVLDGARNWRDSTLVTVLPGNPTRLRLDPQDTALLVGKAVSYRPMLLDQHGNATSATATISASAGFVSLASSGSVVGVAIGRAAVVARSGAFVDSAHVSVVPAGLLAAYGVQYGVPGQPGGIYVFNTDGSSAHWAYRATITYNESIGFGFWPTLSPDGGTVAFIENSKVRLVSASGGIPSDLASGATSQYGPQFSADGQWIYFTRGTFGNQNTFWRIRPNGSGLAQVSEQRSWGIEAMASPSPIDDRVAYQTNDVTNSPVGFTIRTISQTTGAIRRVDVPGSSPRWAPGGDRIAYLGVDGQLAFMAPDGAKLGKLGTGLSVEPGFSWSPTGEWMLVVDRNSGYSPNLLLVESATGRAIPLPFRGSDGQALYQGTWGGRP
jgi:hypothetical protein